MKGVVTAAGLGTRSGLDGKFRKEMLPVYDVRGGRIVLRPIIDVILTGMAEIGVDRVAVVLSPADHWTREYIESEFPEVEILFQEERLGFGHAVLVARDFVGEDDFLLNAGDGLLLHREAVRRMAGSPRGTISLALMKVDNPERYGTAEIEGSGTSISVKHVVEKSPEPPSDLALCAVYRLPSGIFKHLSRATGKNVELTPAIDGLLAEGVPAGATVVERRDWVSVGRAESYVDVLGATLEECRKRVTL